MLQVICNTGFPDLSDQDSDDLKKRVAMSFISIKVM